MCAACVELAEQHNITELGKNENPPSTFHYSFDFAQQLHYPANPLQPGPIFFKTPQKMQFFAVHAEGISRQMNYLIDEDSSCGKGANVVNSMVNHFLAKYGVGEDHLELHADNCSGQNKNNHMMRYLMWRVATGLHKSACISFMVAGHTKFAPDWGFGLLKRTTRRTFVSSQADIEAATTSSSVCNAVQCVGTRDGDVNVTTYDWAAFLGDSFRVIAGLLSFHSFSVSAEAPGVMVVREFAHSDPKRLVLGKGPCPTGEPPVIHPKGLSAERQAYLFKEIREFCREGTEDEVCPRPPQMPVSAPGPVASTSSAPEPVASTSSAPGPVVSTSSAAEPVTSTSTAAMSCEQTAGPSAAKRGRSTKRGGRGRGERGQGRGGQGRGGRGRGKVS